MRMTRPDLISLSIALILLVGCALAPLSLFAQDKSPTLKVSHIGYLTYRGGGTDSQDEIYAAFVQGMRDLGYIVGKNLVIERRSAGGRADLLAAMAVELASLKVEAIVAVATQSTAAAQKATNTIPIVMAGVADPVGSGFVRSLARPGGNITGLSSVTSDLSEKHLEALLSMRPGLKRIAVLMDPSNSGHIVVRKSIEAAAAKPIIGVVPIEARTREELPQALAKASRENAGAVFVNGGFFNLHLNQIAELAVKHKLASISAFREFTEAGGLMSYGQNLLDSYRRAATYVDKILKGSKPADLPVEQPTKFELVVNGKTATALGLKVPQELLVRVDKVIE